MTNEEQLNEVENWVTELRKVMNYGIAKGREGWRMESSRSLTARLHERIARAMRDPTTEHAASAAAYMFMAFDVLAREAGDSPEDGKVPEGRSPEMKQSLWVQQPESEQLGEYFVISCAYRKEGKIAWRIYLNHHRIGVRVEYCRFGGNASRVFGAKYKLNKWMGKLRKGPVEDVVEEYAAAESRLIDGGPET